MGSSSFNRIDRAHQMYREGRYEEALSFYTDALSLAKTDPDRIALHSNRAACFLNLHHFHKAAGECTSILELDHEHTGALMLRAQTLVTLKEYHSALFDVNRLIELKPSSEVYKNFESRLRTQLSLASIPELEDELGEEGGHGEDETEPRQVAGVDAHNPSGKRRPTLALQLQGERPSRRLGAKRIVPDEVSSTRSCSKEKKEDCKGWKAIPKPKGHSSLDYARWDRVEDS
ncbi:hypothetical protein MLD38_021937 [Melastoma candidum]|uniref:Uncharacterized protein n=1 Tax=Melastoma candidum TaxID=119954 RepID=A0ACB9QQR5_9MYRT|nr:hypothetical protein MLD38_021937 [Melastoma candidum]